MAEDKGSAPHPGRVLQKTFMDPSGLGVNQLARMIDVAPARISTILSGQRGVTADTALRFARLFGTTPLYWMNLQARHDLAEAEARLDAAALAEIPTLGRNDKRR